jgi:hypothetical protein
MTQDEHPSVLHPPEETPAELDSLDEMIALLHESNEVRVRDLEAKSGGQASLENAFDALKILTLVEHIALSLEVLDEAMLDFEGKRATMLSGIEDKYAEMLAAREAAQRAAALTQPLQGPNRQQRRHPGPSGIVR